MSKIKVNNVELYYEEVGSGEETIIFSHGYLMDHTMFQAQIDAFKDQFRIIAYDHRGHGKSEATADGYEMENLYADAEAFIEAMDCGPCIFVGMSTGGFIGQRLAIRRPDLIKALVLMNTSAGPEDAKKLTQYNLLLNTVKTIGWRPVIGRVMPILFHESFLKNSARKEDVKRWRNIITGHDKKAVVAFGKGIFARKGIVSELAQIKMPTVVIVGKHDVATPMTDAQQIADAIPDARMRVISDAGHSAAVEKPTEMASAMRLFFERVGLIEGSGK